MIPRGLERGLAASRTHLVLHGPDAAADAAQRALVRKAFPSPPRFPAYVRVTTRDRRSEYYRPSAALPDGVLVLDTGLTDALIDLCCVQAAPGAEGLGRPLAVVLAADAFRREGDFGRYLLCAKAASLQAAAFDILVGQRPPAMAAFAADFVALHEHAHLALDEDLAWTAPIVATVEAARDSYLAHLHRQRADPTRTPDGFVHHLGTPIEAYPEGMVAANLDAIIAVVEGNAALIVEASCDWIAALGLMSSLTGAGFLSDPWPRRASGTWRRAADALFLGVRLSRMLGFLTLYQEGVRNLLLADAAYRNPPSQVEASARLNIVVRLASVFQHTLADVVFEDGPGFPAGATPAQIIDAFLASILRDSRAFHDRIFRLTEIVEPLRRPDLFAAAFAELLGRPPAEDRFADKAAADRLRDGPLFRGI